MVRRWVGEVALGRPYDTPDSRAAHEPRDDRMPIERRVARIRSWGVIPERRAVEIVRELLAALDAAIAVLDAPQTAPKV